MFKSFNCLKSKLIVADIYIISSLYFFPSEGTGNTDNITLTQLQSIDYTLIFLIGAMVNILIIFHLIVKRRFRKRDNPNLRV